MLICCTCYMLSCDYREPGGEVFARTVVVFSASSGVTLVDSAWKVGIFCTSNYRNKFPWIPHLTIYANLRFLSYFVNCFDVLEKSFPLIHNKFLRKSHVMLTSLTVRNLLIFEFHEIKIEFLYLFDSINSLSLQVLLEIKFKKKLRFFTFSESYRRFKMENI